MLKGEYQKIISEANVYADSLWLNIESFFHVLEHSDSSHVSSLEGAQKIIFIFKDWVENNGGWRDIQACENRLKEAAIHRWMFLGAKAYIEDQNLDMSCENNIGVGQEDIKISRGNDKTVIEVKLSSNPDCKHGYEVQLPRYAEAEHTKNMIFVLIKVDNKVHGISRESIDMPEINVIDARPQRSASKIREQEQTTPRLGSTRGRACSPSWRLPLVRAATAVGDV